MYAIRSYYEHEDEHKNTEFDFTRPVDNPNLSTELEPDGVRFEVLPATEPEDIEPDNELDLVIQNQINEEYSEEENPDGLVDYDPTLDLSSYQFPSLDLLDDHGADNTQVTMDELNANKERIVKTLEDYKIQITNIKATIRNNFV